MIDALTRSSLPQKRHARPELASLAMHVAALAWIIAATIRPLHESDPAPARVAMVFAPAPAAASTPATPQPPAPPVRPAEITGPPAPLQPPQTRPAPAAASQSAPPDHRPARVSKPRPTHHAQASPDPVPVADPEASASVPKTTAAPVSQPAITPSGDTMAAWQGALSAWLRAHVTYPEAARRDGDQGRVLLRIVVEPDGTVSSVVLVGSAGSPVLDQAATSLLRDAHLPPRPANGGNGPVTVTIPVRYSLHE